ncbi:TetR/AcrR family transcriptional regulator [Shimia thalassica]|uniref:TetR/AcrR family transcriptional regulator n=1 Tax=Shimia thalassica TaxID=1715693 RepID=UPI0026E13E8D|nr:TetR/AcrR family transcriptional regulator [Shimia thalassica]MDO6797452.1 TetR/AcrR family transcriptional regulator [Shimia thalassica]
MTTPSSPRQRGSRDLWLDAAYDLLISGGIEAVKIMPLAKHLNMTRTGFYWFFKDVAELHAAMILRWEEQNTGILIDRCNAGASNICEALFNLMDCWLDPTLFDDRLDLAIRNWARTEPTLQARLDKADSLRIAAVTRLFARFGFTKEQSEVRGMTVIYTQIGYISMQVAENAEDRLERVQHYVELFANRRPSSQDIATFVRRHKA